MQKPHSLRADIERHLPELAENPEKLTLFVENGRVSANKGTLSHTDFYTLSLMITDFTSDIDVLKTTIIHWLQIHQPDILGAGDVKPNAFVFEVDLLDNHAADVLIKLQLSERVVALIDDKQQIHITHAPEPQLAHDLVGEIGKAWGSNQDWT